MSKFILIDHSIANNSGHYLEYAQNVLAAAEEAGYKPWLVTNRNFESPNIKYKLLKIYKYDVWGKIPENTDIIQRGSKIKIKDNLGKRIIKKFFKTSYKWFRGWLASKAFLISTRKALNKINPEEGDVIFVPTLSTNDILGISDTLRKEKKATRCTWHLLSRHEVGGESNSFVEVKKLRKALNQISVNKNVFFYTDTKELTKQYNHLGIVMYNTLPIPVNKSINANKSPNEKTISLLYLGDARVEKGFQHLPRIVEELYEEYVKTNKINFYIQSNVSYINISGSGRIFEAKEKLEGYRGQGIFLLENPLNTIEYIDILKRNAIGLFLYDENRYRARSSGIFAEFLSAGIPVVVPDKTWMARQLQTFDEEVPGIVFKDISEVKDAIKNVYANYKYYSKEAKRFADKWHSIHCGNNLVNIISDKAKGV